MPASVEKGCCETESPCCEEGIIRDAGDCMVSTCCPGPSKVEKGKYYPLGKRVPSFLNPYTLENGGVMLSYFDVGVAIYFLVAPLSYYLISELNVSSTAYSAYATLISLPWSLKFVFGLISDMNPIYGYRRKSWLLLGWLAFSGFSFFLASLGEPDLTYTAVFMFLMTVSYLQSDVCTDCLAVERARYETEVHKGSLQTSGYTIRAFGMLIGAICGTLLYNTSSWGWGLTVAQLFALNALIPLFGVVPGAWWLEELASNQPPQTLVQHLESVWKTLQLRAVWWPMIFIYSYSVFQIPNSAWTNFLVIALGFTDFELGLLTIAGCAIFWVGMIIYKSFFFETSWRTIYIVTGVIGAVFSVLQVILILRLNVAWGIPDLYFALGDTAIVTLMQAVQAMPACIMVWFLSFFLLSCFALPNAAASTVSSLTHSTTFSHPVCHALPRRQRRSHLCPIDYD